jgi:hypothetical protein
MPEEPTYDIDELIGSGESEPPVIDVLIKSWIAELDKVYSTIQTTGMRYKLESADGGDLDDIWGRIFHIKRYALESDDDYRSRLIVHTRVLMGSGTIPNCEAIIDSLLGLPGATEIESRWPGVVHIGFRDINALRLAKLSKAKIEKLLPVVLAAGMSYDMPFCILEYTLDLLLKCNSNIDYIIDACLQGIRWSDYDLDARFVRGHSQTYNLVAYMQKIRSRQYSIRRGIMMFQRAASYDLDAVMRTAQSTDYSLTAKFTRFGYRSYTLTARIKQDRDTAYSLALYLSRQQKAFYGLSARFEVS